MIFEKRANFTSAYFLGEAGFACAFNADVSFAGAEFSADVSFVYANFNAETVFNSARFNAHATFSSAVFSKDAEATFNYAIFGRDAVFDTVTFGSNACFYQSNFVGEASFSKSTKFIGEANFNSVTFNGEADFGSIICSAGANIDFSHATFISLAVFSDAVFGANVDFSPATFSKDVDLTRTTFNATASFASAIFSGLTLFEGTYFDKTVAFANAQFKDYVKFKRNEIKMFGDRASLTFDSLRIEKSERLSFHSVKLRPHWFINTDPRKFEFIDVGWDRDLTKEREASKSDRLLSIAYRQLAVNAEENSRYDEAMDFRFASMETSLFSLQKKWREDWLKKRWGKYTFETFSWWWEYGTIRKLFSLTWWYRTLSSYGESPTRAAIVLLLILFLSCVPYWFAGFASSKDTTPNNKGVPLRMIIEPEENKAKQFLTTLVYSLETASLQKPEPRPVRTMARLFVGLETILAPLQAALLALAIRRKYMR